MTPPARFAASHALAPAAPARDTVELYLDYCCPFSRRLFLAWHDALFPRARADSRFQIVFNHVIQPWHPASQYMHEAALAVARLDPAAFLPFSRELFLHQDRWFDTRTADKSRHAVYRELADFARDAAGLPADAVYDLLAVRGNDGNAVVRDLKHYVRYHRQNGVHVTPSVAVNGVLAPAIDSATPPDAAWEQLVALSE
ncbi:ACR183Cp [Eremothecium gossypii ATCC 10895]|uniref:ACR183Cp n=1 Tax=Eremothecium gossypii (strain ATCC 10895 / CBS 109.51 / FGSC 9923 / NRRL Y-1056) TaxID=284811 RepID=Q75BT8_EREGS|nr:ACR183Cp [Eremothecium gossypii ATCC 10895]AAS51409.1 ACR183Cp [Eremothecium gossypii ATCC 10895]AEY95700.1 FACR183Cp [Eremothecium gossypii FDAG1]